MQSEQLFPVSFGQQRLWFLNEMEPANPVYRLARLKRITGDLDAGVMARVIQALVERHEALRTVFASVDGEPWQKICANVPVDVRFFGLEDIPAAGREAEALRIAREVVEQRLDLATGPLFRAALIKLQSREHWLLIVMHHIITDGWSMGILFGEMVDLYEAFAKGVEPELHPLPAQYRDYSSWQREHISGEFLASEIEYWTKKLAGMDPLLELPADRPRPAIPSGRGETEYFTIGADILEALRRLGQSEGATLFMTLLAVFQALLWRYSSQDSIAVGTPVAGRNDLETEALVGFFVNTLVMRADFSANPTWRELLRQVRSTALEAYAHQDLPFERLVEEMKPERALNHTPLFQVMFILQNMPRSQSGETSLVLEELDFGSDTAKFDLTLEVVECGALDCAFEYNTDLFDRGTIQRAIEHFQQLIRAIVEDPDGRISEAPLLTNAERKQIVEEWNETAMDFVGAGTIHGAFEAQAARKPENIAFLHEGSELRYRELNERANRLAHLLISWGVKLGDVVGVSIDRSFDLMIALLGILKAGAAYVPLDPSEPPQRLKAMITDSAVPIIITVGRTSLPSESFSGRMLDLESERHALEGQPASNPGVRFEDFAYLIYTSGSTGTPKGVAGTHSASMNRFHWMWRTYPFGPDEVCCHKTALSFVDAVWEIFGPLLQGIPSVLIPGDAVLNPARLVGLLARHSVTRMVAVPALVRMLLNEYEDLATELPALRLWSVSGETLPPDLAKRFRASIPNATMLNIYGCSEVAADVTWHEVSDSDPAWSVPIGKPISNTQIYILDRYRNPVPAGVLGEIYVGGACLARGYWKNLAATQERFIDNPFGSGKGSRLFKTGDLGRYLDRGIIEYLGRGDTQVKIRGVRVELGEIESALRSHPAVRDAAVIVSGEQQKLIAYLSAAGGEVPNSGELRRFLRAKLPDYMLPSSYIVQEELPALPSGKVDRRALHAMAAAQKGGGEAARYVAPQTEVEQSLADIYRDVLKVERVGREDHFFNLGGHSLLAVQVVSRIRRVLDVEISVRRIFEQPEVAALALVVEEAIRAGDKPRRPVLTRSSSNEDRELLMAHLNSLSPDQIRHLLDQLVSRRNPAS